MFVFKNVLKIRTFVKATPMAGLNVLKWIQMKMAIRFGFVLVHPSLEKLVTTERASFCAKINKPLLTIAAAKTAHAKWHKW